MEEKVIIQQRPPKSPAAAGILSLIFPGTGALYNGQVAKGIFYMILLAGLITIQAAHGGQPFKALLLAGFYVFQFIDSIQVAKAINLNASGMKPAAGPADQGVPELVPSGSIFWGIVLIVLGILLILANFEIILYETLFDFWPVAVIVIGLKLVADSVARSKNGN